jgi:hypothetical protein
MLQRKQQELIIIIIMYNNIMQITKEILWFYKYALGTKIRILVYVMAIE